ncbi:PREDICTED: tumor necrosis factor receptor superfamily member 9 [Miniopterus natalensis]|uniref:tumor necrosis factor receptor superfamily member 9 n=1 Tax=Miniopterus natalensis TaxID=291302 RepID=UPI0007A6C678|nr:PREDICTED: tumor necrosis factor receptor superfamily member 9 [Miniopterus natalensis]
MGNRYYKLVAAVLLVMNVERTRSMQASCRNCPAGTFCGKNRSTPCLPCPSDSFSSSGGQEACDPCRRCEGVFRTKRACSATSDAECECVPGFRCQGARCAMCELDCPQGQELTTDGCKDCNVGTFNDQKGGTCRPWTDCSLDGKTVLVNGTKASDVVCGPTSGDFSPGTTSTTTRPPAPEPGRGPQISIIFLALALTLVVLLLVFLTLRISAVEQGRKQLLYLLKQPFMKAVQTAQEEDGCSCGFPEEEEGEPCTL